MPVIYADVVWVVNLIMDGLILVATSWIVKRRVRPGRLFLGSLFGALYAVLMFVPHGALFTTWIGKGIASLVMVVIAIPFRGLLDLAKNTVILYCVTFLLAGATLAMHFAVPAMSLTSGTIIHGGRLAFTTSVGSLAIVAAIPCGLWALHVGIGRGRKLRKDRASLCQVYARLGERRAVFTGLLDTGNQLRDPITRRPVCLVEQVVFRELVPPELADVLDSSPDVVESLNRLNVLADMPALTLVPYRGAGGVSRITVAVRPDELTLVLDDGTKVNAGPCLLAFHAQSLSVEGRFQAVLHTELIAEDDTHEQKLADFQTQHEAPNSITTAVHPHSH